MDKASISEAFGEQLNAITEGTQYALIVDSDNSNMNNIESRIRTVMYSLWMDAQAMRLVRYLEQNKADRFDNLYNFSFGISVYDNDVPFTNRTDTLALKIIDEKAAYNKRLERLRFQYKQFKEICKLISEEDKELFIRYFEESQKVEYETLRNAVINNLTLIGECYGRNEQMAEGNTKEISAAIERNAPTITPEPNFNKCRKRQEKLRKLFVRGK